MIRWLRRRLRPTRQVRDQALPATSVESRRAFDAVRGDHPPAVMVFGVMPRSGTVHVGELLRLHPDLCEYPNRLWELPFLQNSDKLLDFQEAFFRSFRFNTERMAADEFLELFGAALMGYLYAYVPPGQRVLVKEPSMGSFERFTRVFPHENLLLLLRDGRDVVSSTTRTWPDKKFADVCRRWADSANTMLDFHEAYQRRDYWLVKFEHILSAPEDFLTEAFERFALDPTRYPNEERADIPIIGSSTISETGKVDWHDHIAPPKDFQPTRHWVDWPAARKRKFKRLAGAALIRAGYADNDDW